MVELPVAQYNKAMAEQLMSNQLAMDQARNEAASKNEQMRQLTQSAQIYKDNMSAMIPYEQTPQYKNTQATISDLKKIDPKTGLPGLTLAGRKSFAEADQNAREAYWAKTHGAGVPYESGNRDLSEREKFMETDISGRNAYAAFGGLPYQSVLGGVTIKKGLDADAARDQLKHDLAFSQSRDSSDPRDYSENFRAINELYAKQHGFTPLTYQPGVKGQPNRFYRQKSETPEFYEQNYGTTKTQYKKALYTQYPDLTTEQINAAVELNHPPPSVVKQFVEQNQGYIDPQTGYYIPYGENYGLINWDNTKPGGDWSRYGFYKKSARKNVNKTLKQTKQTIYHPLKQQKITKKQKSVFEEMFGKQRADPNVNAKKPATKKAKKSGKKPVSVVEQLFGKRVKL